MEILMSEGDSLWTQIDETHVHERTPRHVGDDDWFRMPAEKSAIWRGKWDIWRSLNGEWACAFAANSLTTTHSFRRISSIFSEKARRRGRRHRPIPRRAIRRVFDAVHQQVRTELQSLPAAVLDEPTVTPHRLFKDKRGALLVSPPRNASRGADRAAAPLARFATRLVKSDG